MKYLFNVTMERDDFEVVGTHYTVDGNVVHVLDGEQFVASFVAGEAGICIIRSNVEVVTSEE